MSDNTTAVDMAKATDKGAKAFEIDDAKAFDENVTGYGAALAAIDPTLGEALKVRLKDLAAGKTTPAEIWDALLAADDKAEAAKLAAQSGAGN